MGHRDKERDVIFAPELIGKILAGEKTMTRRPAKDTSPRVRRRGNRTIISRSFEPKAGRSYAVQAGRGKPATLRIEVTDVREELAGDITHGDANLEGFRSVDEFKAYWVRLYDRDWLRRREQRVEDGAVVTVPLPAGELVARFDDRHAATLVWVIAFRPDRAAPPRYLAARSDELYTGDERQALQGPDGEPEAEALDANTLEAYARTARDRHEQFLASLDPDEVARVRARGLASRLRQEVLAARRAGADINEDLHNIERHIRSIERKRRAA
jgi:hypothetical protein